MIDRPRHFIIGANGEGVPASLEAWARFMESGPARQLERTEIGDVCISTVFLGLDHNYGEGPPLIWETMIFGGPHSDHQERASTRAEALACHAAAVSLASEPPRE